VALGIAVPAAVIASRGESEGGVGALRTEQASSGDEEGKQLFIQNCKSCHTLAAVQARGVTGPNLDDLGGLDRERVLNAIKNGGTGQDRMPAGLLEGADAEAVAEYVAKVAGQ
jgi:mono/diheme cytochrome c family protein